MPQEPLAHAWRTLFRYPALALISIAWDALTLTAALGLTAGLGLGMVTAKPPAGDLSIKLMLPPALPSADQFLPRVGLGPTIGAVNPPVLPVLLAGLVLVLLSALVKGGYLHLLVRALQDKAPTWNDFQTGLLRFGPPLLLWHLLQFGLMLMAVFLAGWMGPLLFVVGIIAMVWFYLTEFIIVADDVSLGTAVQESGPRLVAQFGQLAPVFGVSLLVTLAVSAGFSAAGLLSAWTIAPVWGFLGTWLALAVLAVLRPVPVHATGHPPQEGGPSLP